MYNIGDILYKAPVRATASDGWTNRLWPDKLLKQVPGLAYTFVPFISSFIAINQHSDGELGGEEF